MSKLLWVPQRPSAENFLKCRWYIGKGHLANCCQKYLECMLCKDPSFYGKDHATESGKQLKKAYLDDLLGQKIQLVVGKLSFK